MRQLLLDLGAEKPQTLDTFVVGQNAELTHLLRRLATGATDALNERFVYLWGENGAGKSHLLQALAASSTARYFAADAPADAFVFAPPITLYLLDDCDKLGPDHQIAAFSLFNQVRENGGVLVA